MSQYKKRYANIKVNSLSGVSPGSEFSDFNKTNNSNLGEDNNIIYDLNNSNKEKEDYYDYIDNYPDEYISEVYPNSMLKNIHKWMEKTSNKKNILKLISIILLIILKSIFIYFIQCRQHLGHQDSCQR